MTPAPQSSSPTAERSPQEVLGAQERAADRALLGIGQGQAVFFGVDAWTGYALSWRNRRGKPQIAAVRILIPCESTHRLQRARVAAYLMGCCERVFADEQALREQIEADVGAAIWPDGKTRGSVSVEMIGPEHFDRLRPQPMEGVDLDRLRLECDSRRPPECTLQAAEDEQPASEVLTSRLLAFRDARGRPDLATIQIRYTGPQIDQARLLRYIVAYRQWSGEPEACVEQIFMDIWRQCRPAKLAVYARCLRRDGVEVNPYRTSHPGRMPSLARTPRQ